MEGLKAVRIDKYVLTDFSCHVIRKGREVIVFLVNLHLTLSNGVYVTFIANHVC